jgi:hypothetical protein
MANKVQPTSEKAHTVMGDTFDGPDSLFGRIFEGPDSLFGRVFGTATEETPVHTIRVTLNRETHAKLGEGKALTFKAGDIEVCIQGPSK